MTGRGYYRTARGLLDHPIFTGERFDQRSAWLSIVEGAVWKDVRQFVNGRAVDLQRGQLTVSTRYLARRWAWSEAGVRRFLKRLVANQMITIRSDGPQMILSVVNYAKYQDGNRRSEPPATEHENGASDAGPLFASVEETMGISNNVATSDAPPTHQPTQEATHQPTQPRASQVPKSKRKSEARALQPTHQPTQEATHQPTQRIKKESNEGKERERRATRFPPDAILPDDWRAWAAHERPDLNPDQVFERFRDYWIAKPGRPGLKLDWTATWRNWVRGERAPAGARTKAGGMQQALRDNLERARRPRY